MAKLNKTTHLMILFTFAIVFVVIYLYYTISDVKKMNSDVKKLVLDVAKLNQDVQNILAIMPKIPMTASNLQIPTPSQQSQSHGQPQQVPPKVQQVTVQPNVQITSQQKQPILPIVDESDEEDDVSSVDTDELKKIINDADGVPGDVLEQKEAEPPIQEYEQDITEELSAKTEIFSEEDLKKLKYDEIKDLCRTRGISTRGTKEQLIAKLQADI